jgi:hypothetical protein
MRSKKSIRKAFIKLLPRLSLETVSNVEAPWQASREHLEQVVLFSWPANDIETEIAKLLREARD